MDKHIMELQPGYSMEYYLAEDVDSLQQELLAYRDMVERLNGKCDGLEKENERLKELYKQYINLVMEYLIKGSAKEEPKGILKCFEDEQNSK